MYVCGCECVCVCVPLCMPVHGLVCLHVQVFTSQDLPPAKASGLYKYLHNVYIYIWDGICTKTPCNIHVYVHIMTLCTHTHLTCATHE